MEWKDLERMTVLKLREEALKYPQIQGVHGKNKERLMDELATILGVAKPHAHLSHSAVNTKSDLKHQIHALKLQRETLITAHDHAHLHDVRRQIHELKHEIRKIESKAAHA